MHSIIYIPVHSCLLFLRGSRTSNLIVIFKSKMVPKYSYALKSSRKLVLYNVLLYTFLPVPGGAE